VTGAALVTGARRGIGKAIAMTLAAEGFDVVVNDVAESDELRAVAGAIAALGRKSAAVAGDISDTAGHTRMLDAAEAAIGPLTTLVNNAGVSVMSRGDLLEVTAESYDRCLDINTRGTFFLTQAFARRLLARPAPASHRSIVTISSSNAVCVDRPRRILHFQGGRLGDVEAVRGRFATTASRLKSSRASSTVAPSKALYDS
jgi:NAD(P)-dependent dehydrogenase (short-subunit alcohol dehydrogenase family)